MSLIKRSKVKLYATSDADYFFSGQKFLFYGMKTFFSLNETITSFEIKMKAAKQILAGYKKTKHMTKWSLCRIPVLFSRIFNAQ